MSSSIQLRRPQAALVGLLLGSAFVVLGGCGSVPGRAIAPDSGLDVATGSDTRNDTGIAGSSGQGGRGVGGGAGGAGGGTAAGGAPGTDGGGQGGARGDAGLVLRGGIEAVGKPGASAVPTLILTRSRLSYPQARICNTTVCVSGGIKP